MSELLINLEPFDEQLERGIRHHCPNCSRLDKERDFRTNPGGMQIDCVRYEQELAVQAKVIDAQREALRQIEKADTAYVLVLHDDGSSHDEPRYGQAAVVARAVLAASSVAGSSADRKETGDPA